MNWRNFLYRCHAYVKHQFASRNTMGYGVHSPYLFHIVRDILPDHTPYYSFARIEACRREMLDSRESVHVADCGTGQSGRRRVADIARTSLKPPFQAQLLMRLAVATGAKEILELGTSLGITTAYLASAGKQTHVVTMEGAPEVARVAQQNWQSLGLDNIECVVGPIDDTLYIRSLARTLDLVFIDANHTGEALLRYFGELQKRAGQRSLFVVDDIHASRDMQEAWLKICQMPGVTATMDLFHLGLVFFDKNLEKKMYRVRL